MFHWTPLMFATTHPTSHKVVHHHPSIVFYVVALLAMLYLGYNLRKFWLVKKGKPEPRDVNLVEQISNILFYGLGQRRVFSLRFTYPAIMHFFIGFGFFELLFATTVDFFLTRGWFLAYLPTMDTPWFACLNDTAGAMVLIGLLMALYRRHFMDLGTLPQNAFSGRGHLFGDTGILLIFLLVIITGFLSEATRLAVEKPATAHWSWLGYPLAQAFSVSFWLNLKPYLWWTHAVLSLAFIALIPQTKMFHIFAVVVNMFFTNKKERRRLRPMHVSKVMEDPDLDPDEISFGAAKPSDFTWKQLLDSVACTECGRCTAVCPAARTGRPLSPMKVITDIRYALYNKPDENSQEDEDEESSSNGEIRIIDNLIDEEELWSCTTCGACTEVCPIFVDHIPQIVDMRRHLVLSEGRPKDQAADSLELTSSQGNPWGQDQEDRLKWAEDAGLDVPVMAEKKKADVLYWVGCAGAFDPLNQPISVAMIKILEAAGIDYAVLGEEEQCTGDSARRMGEEYLFETMAMQNIETLNQYEFKKIVTACPHCYNTLGNEYGEFGGNYEVVHHSEFIAELLTQGKIKTEQNVTEKVTYHDPCYLGRHNGVYDAPREVLNSVVPTSQFVEMKENRESSFCCGAGGGNMWYELDEEKERINHVRFEQAMETGATTVATACSFCAIMMDDAMKAKKQDEKMKVKDIAQFVAENLKE